MHNNNIAKLKKYLFFISMIFAVLTSIHIINVYLYNDSKIEATEGGAISEGFIGDFAHLNPLILSNDYNKYINSFLYRSLLKYDSEQNKFVGDLANCDISKLNYVECYLNENITWSNGENITSKDILSTYNILKTLNLNPNLSSILENTTIEERAGVIIFSNRKKNVNFLNILLQPIVSQTILDSINSKELKGTFNPFDGIYSGKYIVENISYDETLGIRKLILTKNEKYYKNDVYITKIVFKFFKDVSHFLKHKDGINLFLDNENIISGTIPRLNKYDFTLSQYFSLFINSSTIKNKDLRTIIFNNINTENILASIGKKGYKEVQNPYLSEIDISRTVKDNNIELLLNEIGYYKKDNLLDASIDKEKHQRSKTIFDEKNTTLKYIKGPITNKYSFLSNDDILIKGDIGEKTPYSIYLNDYKLKSYEKGTKNFFYRLKTSYKNIKEGVNEYNIYFESEGEKELVESFTIVYNKDEDKLTEEKEKIIDKYLDESENSSIEKEMIKTKQEEISELKDEFYYNSNNEKFELKLVFIDSQKEVSDIVNNIEKSLEIIGIGVEKIPLSISNLNKMLKAGEKDYDLLLTGINLGYFDFNIFHYFHSSQAKNGFNFSNIRKPSLDLPLEELKSNLLTDNKKDKLKEKVLDILKEEQIVKTLFTPIISNLVDQNIYKYSLSNKLANSDLRIDSINKSFVKSEKNIVFEEKGLFDFINFIIDIFKDVNND